MKDLCLNKNKNIKSNLNIQSSDLDKNSITSDSSMQSSGPNKNSATSNLNIQSPANRNSPLRNDINNTSIQQYSEMDNSDNRRNGNKISLPAGSLTKSRYISLLSDQIIRDNWPKLSSRSTPIIESIINQPIEFDNGTSKIKLFSNLNFIFIYKKTKKILIVLLNKMVLNNMHY